MGRRVRLARRSVGMWGLRRVCLGGLGEGEGRKGGKGGEGGWSSPGELISNLVPVTALQSNFLLPGSFTDCRS